MNDDLHIELNAYIDGELSADDEKRVENRIRTDVEYGNLYESLKAVDLLSQSEFDKILEQPVPSDLLNAIMNARDGSANSPMAPSGTRSLFNIAASICLLFLGSAFGFGVAVHKMDPDTTAADTPDGWLQDIAEYHAVYESQTRHLVEVGAEEIDHINGWLGKTVELSYEVPDLSSSNLTFMGARLVVAAGKPVGQLVYKTDSGDVVALCFLKSGKLDSNGVKEQQVGVYHMVSWRKDGGAFVIIGTQERAETIRHAAEYASLL